MLSFAVRSVFRVRVLPVLLILPAWLALGVGPAAAKDLPHECWQTKSGDKCQHGGGRHTPGGNGNVSHAGWPRIWGVFWQVTAVSGRKFRGGAKSDELLGHHGSDRIFGRAGSDVVWGDWNPVGNTTRQHDILYGGAGNDWLYSSHGYNQIRGGHGQDHIWAFYGHGTIDCGPGSKDVVRIRPAHKNRYKVKRCEKIERF